MKKVNMGINSEPSFLNADEVIERIKLSGNKEAVEYWKKEKERTLKLRDEIIRIVEEEGECELVWSCDGATRYNMHSCQWQRAMPQYDFEISRYECIVRKHKEE